MIRAARVHATHPDPTRADLRIDELDAFHPGPGQVLLDVAACGVCASDLHVVQGITPAAQLPMTLGHEAAGTISAVGPAVTQWQVGDRVVIPPGRVCGTCPMCRGGRDNLCQHGAVRGVTIDGAQASAVVVDATQPLPIPSSLPFPQAAILPDAVATPYHAMKRGGVHEGSTVAVIGVGGLGFHAVQLSRLAGAEVIGIDIDEVARDRATAAGASQVYDAADDGVATTVRTDTAGGVDIALEFVGRSDTAALASSVLRPGGRAVLVGLSRDRLTGPPLGLFVSQEQEVVGSFGATLADIHELIDLHADGRLDLTQSVSHKLGLDDFPTALAMLHTRDDHPLRIVIDHTI